MNEIPTINKYIKLLLIVIFFFIINITLFQSTNKIDTITKKKYEFFMSPIDGIGVRAVDNIKKGEVIAEEPYLIINGDEKSLEQYKWFISNTYILINGLGNYANHSDDNNIAITSNRNNEKFIVFKALKDIKKGEELFNNYGTLNWFKDRKIPKK